MRLRATVVLEKGLIPLHTREVPGSIPGAPTPPIESRLRLSQSLAKDPGDLSVFPLHDADLPPGRRNELGMRVEDAASVWHRAVVTQDVGLRCAAHAEAPHPVACRPAKQWIGDPGVRRSTHALSVDTVFESPSEPQPTPAERTTLPMRQAAMRTAE
jgi:hypothetical protein